MNLADEIEQLLDLLPLDQQQRFSLEAFCGTHAPQLAACQDLSNWQHWMCARQAGKSWGLDGVLLDNALKHPNSTNVLLGIKGTGVRTNNWFPIWRPLCERWNIDCTHNETEMRTTFPNGARVMFAGTDDLSNVRKYLGNRLANGVFVVDESQDQASQVLRYLLLTLLPPMLTETSRVILAGVLPDLPAGYFYELADSAAYSHHMWGRAANIHTPDAMADLQRYMAQHGLTLDDPQIQRDWFLRRVWDTRLTAFRYDAARNGWMGAPATWAMREMLPPGHLLAVEPPPGVDTYAIGLDPAATADRFAIVLWGWSSRQRAGLWHIAEWVTDRGANALESQYLAVVAMLKMRYGNIIRVIRDAGSSATTNDVLLRNHGILIEPAIKGPGSRKARVDRLADALGTGQAHILVGSELENDLKLAKWSLKAREEGRYDWDSSHHPDVGDAGTYGAVAFHETAPVAEVRVPASEAAAKAEAEAVKALFERPPPREAWMDQDRGLDALGFSYGGDPG